MSVFKQIDQIESGLMHVMLPSSEFEIVLFLINSGFVALVMHICSYSMSYSIFGNLCDTDLHCGEY